MLRIITKIVPKTWGRELWLWSPLDENPTKLEDGTVSRGGPLIKILIADETLPIQVHPDDKMAKQLENQENGKSESWYVLRTFKPNAGFVVGLKDYSPEKIKEMIRENTFENNLVWSLTKPGDFYYCPAGMVHAMGGGVEALEVQQPSDITYRYYDFNRLVNGKPREMQLDKAILCQKKNLSTHLKPTETKPLTYETFYATQIFPKSAIIAPGKGVAVDLGTKFAFLVEKGEKIDFDKFAFIQFKDVYPRVE